MLPALAQTLGAKGIDPAPVFARAGLRVTPAGGGLERIPLATLERLWAAAVDATGDPLIGLEVGARLRPASWHAFGLALQASADLRTFGERLARSMHFVSDAAALCCHEVDDALVLSGRARRGRIPPESEDAFCVFIDRFIADLSGGTCRPRAGALMRAPPPDGGRRHVQLLGCPVTFAQEAFELRFALALADVPFAFGSEELATVNDQVVVAYLAKLDRSDIVARARACLIEDLPSGRVSKTRVAARLNVSPRTLQNKLARRGTTFHALVDETRLSLVRAYLEDRSRSLTEIAYLVGFSSPGNMSRAFKRWTGQTPADTRRGKGD